MPRQETSLATALGFFFMCAITCGFWLIPVIIYYLIKDGCERR